MSTPGHYADASRSLPEVYGTVPVQQMSGWRRLFAFAGPAYLVSVGYMDPGNWATDLEGGARFGYQLLWVLVMSNAMAILLQTLSARLGIVARRDLAQACREAYPPSVCNALWLLCEVAIAACDLAEVLGAAIALNLLFHLPLLAGVLLTAADTLLVLYFTRLGMRVVEGFVLLLVTVIGLCFFVEILLAKPVWSQVALGLVPRLNDQSLYIAIGILGATVMPHNLYLHSALVQTRQIGESIDDKRVACRFNFIDSAVALNGSLLVNAAILVMAGAVFFQHGRVVTEIQQAHELLTPLLGSALASTLFAVALLCSGQSSTLTGTMAGQIVMEGFLQLRVRPWLRRLVTRVVAIAPAALTIWLVGEQASFQLLILSQVILSLQLPFAVIPLIQFTSDRRRMGEFASPAWVRALAWISAAVIVALNLRLAATTLGGWVAATSGPYRTAVAVLLYGTGAALLLLLLRVALEPLLSGAGSVRRRAGGVPVSVNPGFEPPHYQRILVPLDHSGLDALTVSHAAALAAQHKAMLYLLHVEEDVTSQIYGSQASTAEVEEGREYFRNIGHLLREQGLQSETVVRHSSRPKREIVRFAREIQADLVVMGAHGHRGLKDLIFGTTINAVRHHLDVPLLIVRPGRVPN